MRTGGASEGQAPRCSQSSGTDTSPGEHEKSVSVGAKDQRGVRVVEQRHRFARVAAAGWPAGSRPSRLQRERRQWGLEELVKKPAAAQTSSVTHWPAIG